jgi:N-acetylglucosaminyldiphosphoundecaprenol N-acetyl-beta-D-mannosaminyltransferase
VTAQALQPRAHILGCVFDRLSMAETIARIEGIIAARRPSQHLAISATNVVAVQEDPRLRTIMEECAIVSADGQGIVWASKLLGDPLPERVNAADLMEALFPVAEAKGYRIYVLGARQDVLERAISNLERRFPKLEIAGYRNGYFGSEDDAEVVEAIRSARSDLLFAAMSSPKKEYWLAEHKHELGVPFVMGVGGAIDAVAGLTRRAPMWVRKIGMEWFFRMIQEPRRLARRFVIGNAKFLWILLGELARQPLRSYGRS